MGKNKKIRKRIIGLDRQITLHGKKIGEEIKRTNPNEGLINHWMKEIDGWQRQVDRLEKRWEKQVNRKGKQRKK